MMKKILNYALYCPTKEMYVADSFSVSYQKEPHLVSRAATVYKWYYRLLDENIETTIQEFEISTVETERNFVDEMKNLQIIKNIETELDKKYGDNSLKPIYSSTKWDRYDLNFGECKAYILLEKKDILFFYCIKKVF
jgi:hypothetical protein